MSIGSNLVVSAPAVGLTTHTLARINDNTFSVKLTPEAGYPDVPLVAVVRPSSVSGKQKSLGVTLYYNPSVIEDEVKPSLGKATITINCVSTLGTVITETLCKTLIGEALSILCTASVIDALMDGSSE